MHRTGVSSIVNTDEHTFYDLGRPLSSGNISGPCLSDLLATLNGKEVLKSPISSRFIRFHSCDCPVKLLIALPQQRMRKALGLRVTHLFRVGVCLWLCTALFPVKNAWHQHVGGRATKHVRDVLHGESYVSTVMCTFLFKNCHGSKKCIKLGGGGAMP